MPIKNIKQNKLIKCISSFLRLLNEDGIYELSGYVTYKFIISLIPLAAVFTVFLSGVPAIENWLMRTIEPIIAPQAYSFVKYILSLARQNAKSPVLSLSMAVTLYTASSSVHTLMRGISVAAEGRGCFETRGRVKNRAIAVSITVLGYILLISAGVIAMAIDELVPTGVLGYAVLAAAIMLMLALIYKAAPVSLICSGDAVKRALFSCVMITALILGINIYYSRISDISSVYGAFAGVAVIMMGIYGMAFCIISAAEGMGERSNIC